MKALQKYFKNRISDINFILEQQQQFYTSDTFHKLRLEIKKLNALFDLINYSSKKSKHNKTFKPFKLIFKQAGKIRELQVEEALLKTYLVSDFITEYKNDLQKILKEEFNNFFLITNQPFAKKLQKKYLKIDDLIAKTSKKKATQYMGKKRIEIEKLLDKKVLKKKQIHALRKSLKKYLFNQKMLNYSKKDKIIPKEAVLPELLGEWHDYQTVIKHLKKAIHSGEINPKESNNLENGVTTFTYKSQLLFTQINTTLQDTHFRNK